MAENRIRPEEFEDRIIFVSMHNDIDRTKDGNSQMCVSNSVEINAYTNRFPNGYWSFLGPGIKEKWDGTHICKPEGRWNHSAEMIMLNLGESGHPVIRATSA